jgi:hypothetical protein
MPEVREEDEREQVPIPLKNVSLAVVERGVRFRKARGFWLQLASLAGSIRVESSIVLKTSSIFQIFTAKIYQ